MKIKKIDISLKKISMPIKDFKFITCSNSYFTKNSIENQKFKIKKNHKLNFKFSIVIFIILIISITVFMYYFYPNLINSLKLKNKNFFFIKTKKWKYIIIHHGGGKTKKGDAYSYNQFHQKKFKTGLLYHFVIGNGEGKSKDGEIEIGFRWKKQISGAHVSNEHYKNNAIGICLTGDLNYYQPTTKQLIKLVNLIKYLINTYKINIKNIFLHHELVKTKCPGKLFPENLLFNTLLKSIKMQL